MCGLDALLGVPLERIVGVHDLKGKQKLPLVGMDPLDLDIEGGIRIDLDAGGIQDILGKAFLVVSFGGMSLSRNAASLA